MSDATLILIEEAVIILLLIATLVAIAFRRLRAPYTVGLVLVGALLALLGNPVNIRVTPALILGLLVPPLLFEAAFHLSFDDLRQNLRAILVLAIPGVVITTLLVAGVVAWGTGLSLSMAIIFGALIAATDPVAVIALFRRMGVPRRLQVLLEGESLFNDGTAVVVFSLALVAATSGEFSLTAGIADFFVVAGGGVLLGFVLGVLTSFLIGRINDHLIETSLTFILAYGAYLLAEHFHVSGVLAVVAAGLLSGNLGPRAMSPTTRIVVFNFWQFAAFLANSFVFLLIGLEVEISLLVDNWAAILVAIAAVLFARAAVIYLIPGAHRDLPFRWQHIIFWGGLRGAVALALALSIPFSLSAGRSTLQAMAFGVVLFTLVVQGISMQPLVQRLGIAPRHEKREEFKLHQARIASIQSAYEHLKGLHSRGMISNKAWRSTSKVLDDYLERQSTLVQDLLENEPMLAREEIDLAWREVLRAQRSALVGLHTDGMIGEEAYSELVGRIDASLGEDELDWGLIESQPGPG